MPNITQFCPIPIYQNFVDFTKDDYDKLTSCEMIRFDEGNGCGSLNTNILNDFQLLKEKIQFEVDKFVYDYLRVRREIKFGLENSWLVRHDKNDWAQKHFHSNSAISGILYLNVDENSGDIIFYKGETWDNIFSKMIDIPYAENNNLNTTTWIIKPRVAEIILFPSHLHHSVTKNLSNISRYCLVFNFFPRGTFGIYDTRLYHNLVI
jgi:uncharacterized protein (TIGR02466 family)